VNARWLTILTAVGIVCGFGFRAQAQASAEASFREGVAAYQSGHFADAAKVLRASVAAEPAAGTLLNLGLVEWRRGRAGAAILAWEQAAWIDPFDARVQDNLKFARDAASVEPPTLTWYETASSWLPPNDWAWITGGALTLALGMVTLPGVLRGRKAGWHQALAALGLCVFLLSIPAHVGVLTRTQLGFVLERKTPLRLTPTEEAEVVVELSPGEPARRERERGNYVFIRTANVSGWIAREQFGLICPE
jgi:tetratricopeptide (TPR) repeat protein